MMKCIISLACVLAAGLGITAEPEIINLARTSLAEVTGSPVNGGRPIDDPYYGVLNLFDDGQHRLNNTSYTYWLGGGTDSWVELRFQAPVTVTAIILEAPKELSALAGHGPRDLLANPPLYSARTDLGPFLLVAYNQEGTVVIEKEATFVGILNHRHTVVETITDASFTFPQPLTGVTRIRLSVPRANTRIDEWRVLGIPPVDAPYTAGLPRIARTAAGSGNLAAGLFQEWLMALGKDAASDTEETPTAFITTFRKDDLPLFRVTVDKASGQAAVEPLVEWAPKKE